MSKHLAGIALAAVVVLPVRAEILEQILVKVNGEILTKTALEERQVSVLRQQDRGLTAEDLRNDEQLKKILAEITPRVVVEAVDEMLLMQRGRELGYVVSDEQFKSIVENIRKENNLASEEAFQAALKQEGMTMEELRRMLERQVIVSRVQQADVWNRIAITEDEARAAYDAQRDQFTTPAEVTLREILVDVRDLRPPGAEALGPGVNVGLDDEAREKVEQLRARILAGEDFASLAARESDSGSKANGGLIGPINETELAPALRQLVAAMKVGEVTQPFRTARGYQILKLESRTEARVLSFEDAREQVSNKVFEQKRSGEMTKYLEKLRAQAIIEWKNEEVKKLYEQALVQRQSQAAALGK
jgi:peptidyl-prolyl cis-trans isomerase SurA